jgi:lysophospholipase L1-like esterase
MKSGRICIWGDSITWGASDIEKGGWVNRLRLYADNELSEDISVYNLGISGDTTDDLILRFEAECKAREPEIIIFAIGINDSYYLRDESNPKVSLQRFRNNLQKLIDVSKKYSKQIIFIGLTPVDESKTMPIPWDADIYYDNEMIKGYDLELKNVAQANSARYLHMFDLITSDELEDGLHPNSMGHEKMFKSVKDFCFNRFE